MPPRRRKTSPSQPLKKKSKTPVESRRNATPKLWHFGSLLIALAAALYCYRYETVSGFLNLLRTGNIPVISTAPLASSSESSSPITLKEPNVPNPAKSPESSDAVDLHDENPLFTVFDIPGKGKGAIANRDIQQGELVLHEKPLFVVPRHVQSSPTELLQSRLNGLLPLEREIFMNLSYVNFPDGLNPSEHPEEVALAIFQTNAVAAGEEVGIFPRMARINHGCSSAFNVVYMWRDLEQRLVVHALKNIKKGQELLTTYTDSKKPREQRRDFLAHQYGFHCTCAVCSLPEPLSKASDERLVEISELYKKFATWSHREIDGAEAIMHIRRIWEIEDEEGYWSERGQLAADAAWIAASHSDDAATKAWATKAAEWYSYEIGADSPQVHDMKMVVQDPMSFRPWDSREKLEVGGPD